MTRPWHCPYKSLLGGACNRWGRWRVLMTWVCYLRVSHYKVTPDYLGHAERGFPRDREGRSAWTLQIGWRMLTFGRRWHHESLRNGSSFPVFRKSDFEGRLGSWSAGYHNCRLRSGSFAKPDLGWNTFYRIDDNPHAGSRNLPRRDACQFVIDSTRLES